MPFAGASEIDAHAKTIFMRIYSITNSYSTDDDGTIAFAALRWRGKKCDFSAAAQIEFIGFFVVLIYPLYHLSLIRFHRILCFLCCGAFCHLFHEIDLLGSDR